MPLLCVISYFFYLKFSYKIYRYEIVQRISPESLNDILKKFHEWFPKTSCFEKKFRGPNRKSQRYLEKIPRMVLEDELFEKIPWTKSR